MSLLKKFKNTAQNKEELKLQKGINTIQTIIDKSNEDDVKKNIITATINEIQSHPEMPVGEFMKLLQEKTELSDSDLVAIIKQIPDILSEKATIDAVEKTDLPSAAITQIIEEAPISPNTAQEIAKQIPDEEIQKEQEEKLKKVLEKQNISKLNSIYDNCEDVNDIQLVKFIDELAIDNKTDKINDLIISIIAKRTALDCMLFGGPKLPTLMKIIPAIDLLEADLPLLSEIEYQKLKEEYDGKNKKYRILGEQEKQVIKTKLIENIAKKVAKDFKEIGDINIPQTEQLKDLSEDESQIFISTVINSCYKEHINEEDMVKLQQQLSGKLTESEPTPSQELENILAEINSCINSLPEDKRLSSAKIILNILQRKKESLSIINNTKQTLSKSTEKTTSSDIEK